MSALVTGGAGSRESLYIESNRPSAFVPVLRYFALPCMNQPSGAYLTVSTFAMVCRTFAASLVVGDAELWSCGGSVGGEGSSFEEEHEGEDGRGGGVWW